MSGVGRGLARVLLVPAAVSGACLLIGQSAVILGAGAWARSVLHVGVTVLLVTPFVALLWLIRTLWRADPAGAGFALGTLAVSVLGVLLALAGR